MKKILFASLCALLLAACIDEDFDLFDAGFDGIGIGGEESDFRMPLANISVRTSALSGGGRTLTDLFDEADTWLPTVLPDGGDAVDLRLLTSDSDPYRTTLVRAMLDEAAADASKLNDVAALAERRYASEFAGIVPAGAAVSDFIVRNYSDAVYGPAVRTAVERLAGDYLAGLRMSLDAVECRIGAIDVDDDVFDMLTGGLDGPDAPAGAKTLTLYGTVENSVPVDCSSDVAVAGTAVTLTLDALYGQTTGIAETDISESELRTVLDDARLTFSVGLERYYKGRAFPEAGQTAITIRLSLHRHGGLSL